MRNALNSSDDDEQTPVQVVGITKTVNGTNTLASLKLVYSLPKGVDDPVSKMTALAGAKILKKISLTGSWVFRTFSCEIVHLILKTKARECNRLHSYLCFFFRQREGHTKGKNEAEGNFRHGLEDRGGKNRRSQHRASGPRDETRPNLGTHRCKMLLVRGPFLLSGYRSFLAEHNGRQGEFDRLGVAVLANGDGKQPVPGRLGREYEESHRVSAEHPPCHGEQRSSRDFALRPLRPLPGRPNDMRRFVPSFRPPSIEISSRS